MGFLFLEPTGGDADEHKGLVSIKAVLGQLELGVESPAVSGCRSGYLVVPQRLEFTSLPCGGGNGVEMSGLEWCLSVRRGPLAQHGKPESVPV
jgi:hypothetical protein